MDGVVKPVAKGRARTRWVEVSAHVLRRNRVVSRLDDDPAVVDAYRLLRTRVRHRMAQNNWVTLGITSPGAREGKSLTAINLGLSLAREQKYSVLLVDADLRRPAVHRTFGIEPERGLSDHLVHATPVEHLLLNPGVHRFTLLPGNPQVPVSPEHLSGERMRALVQELRGRYPDRLVLFDLPPVLIGDDVVTLAPALDALLLVVAEGATQSDELGRALELIDHHPLLGTVLNMSREVAHTYGDYYR